MGNLIVENFYFIQIDFQTFKIILNIIQIHRKLDISQKINEGFYSRVLDTQLI